MLLFTYVISFLLLPERSTAFALLPVLLYHLFDHLVFPTIDFDQFRDVPAFGHDELDLLL